MNYPQLNPIPIERSPVDIFWGLNQNYGIREGEFSQMENLTSDCFPVLSPRQPRQTVLRPASPQGLIAKEAVCYVDGSDFVIGDQRIPMDLSTEARFCPKQLVSMGAYVIILPDKVYINTRNPEDRGLMDAVSLCMNPAVTLCREDGTPLEAETTRPETPENGQLWLDSTQEIPSLKQWSAATEQWVSVSTTWVRLDAPDVGRPFARYDCVKIKIVEATEEIAVPIQARGDDYIVIPGPLSQYSFPEGKLVQITRQSPEMDFVFECGNRLWGCFYGFDFYKNEYVNRIYASKLGDFKNWNCFQGLSTDSYYVDLGTDGDFTGAIAHMGYPLFFKENWLHKVYGSQPSEFAIQDTPCRGVQRDCHQSLAIVGETLLYKSRTGVCAYDGSLPVDISHPLGKTLYSHGVAGAHDSKYYLSIYNRSRSQYDLLVYDTTRNLWHREDGFQALAFASVQGKLYAIDGKGMNILVLAGAEEPDEGPVAWMAQTGLLGLGYTQRKYISRINLRLSMGVGSWMDVYARYDGSDSWEYLCHIRGTDLTSFSVPVKPRRCDHFALRFVGRGPMKLYGMTKFLEKGSDD